MSYEIVKGITIKDNKVFIRSACNNVTPKDFTAWECDRLSRLLVEKGLEAVELEILKAYEEGNFHPGNENKYTRTIQRLRHFPEYKTFDWNQNRTYEDDDPVSIARKSPEFNKLLLLAFNSSPPKSEFILSKPYPYSDRKEEIECYLSKVTKTKAEWSVNKNDAKIFNYQIDCEDLKKCFVGGDRWKIIELNPSQEVNLEPMGQKVLNI